MASENTELGNEDTGDMEKQNVEEPVPPKKTKVKFIKMHRDPDGVHSHEADVHPDSVEQWKSEGWMIRE